MREKYFCPNCRGVITCGERYCGTCGTALRWVIPQSIPDIAEEPHDATRTARGKSAATGTMTSLGADVAKLLVEFEKQLRLQNGSRSEPSAGDANQN